MVEIVTIEKGELIHLIESAIETAIEKAIRSVKPPEIMNKEEVGRYLKKSPATINRWMRKKGLPYHGVGQPTFKRDEIDTWLARI